MKLTFAASAALLCATAFAAAPLRAQTGVEDGAIYFASNTWPVRTVGPSCAMERAGEPNSGSGRLSVAYDAARREVTLATEAAVESGLPPSGDLRLHLVFLDNGETLHDDQWGARRFAYTSRDGVYRFTTAFAGENNVRQILADLAGSRRLGLLHEGEVLFDHDLAGTRASLARLRDCAAQRIAAR